MPSFGSTSKKRKEECVYPIQEVLDIAIQIVDFTILCGARYEKEQHDAFVDGRSKVDWPNSKHNPKPENFNLSEAVDVAPYYSEKPNVRWPDLYGTAVQIYKTVNLNIADHPESVVKEIGTIIQSYGKRSARFYYLAGLLKGIAFVKGIPWRSGCDWDGDGDFTDQSFDDLPHHETRRK